MPTDSPTLRYRPDPDEDLSAAIITALSKAKGRDVTEDDYVLYDNIDADALDRLFGGEGQEDTIKVEFTTHDAIVVLWGNGRLTVEVQDLSADDG